MSQLFGFICFGAEAHHIPMIMFVVVLINGMPAVHDVDVVWLTSSNNNRGFVNF